MPSAPHPHLGLQRQGQQSVSWQQSAGRTRSAPRYICLQRVPNLASAAGRLPSGYHVTKARLAVSAGADETPPASYRRRSGAALHASGPQAGARRTLLRRGESTTLMRSGVLAVLELGAYVIDYALPLTSKRAGSSSLSSHKKTQQYKLEQYIPDIHG